MLFKGYKKPLTFDDMTELRQPDTCRSVVPLFEKAWYGKVRDCDPRKKCVLLLSSLPILPLIVELVALNIKGNVLLIEVSYCGKVGTLKLFLGASGGRATFSIS